MNLYRLIEPFNQFAMQAVLKTDEDLIVPFDEGNTDYIAYLAWVAEGNTAEKWQPESEGN
jgi:hypothetical protein